jgi:hypothetical protein
MSLYRVLMSPFWLLVQVAKFPFLLAVFSVGMLTLPVLHDSASRHLLVCVAAAGEVLWWALFAALLTCTRRAER